MYSARNISNGFSKFVKATTTITSHTAKATPAIAVKHKEPVLKNSKLDYVVPHGTGCVTTSLLGKNSLIIINFVFISQLKHSVGC